jgi:UPF0755 protein
MMRAFFAMVVVVLLGVGGAYVLWLKPQLDALSQPGAREDEMTFEVAPGSSQKAVIQKLAQVHLIRDWRVLYSYSRYMKLGAPKAGEYIFPPDASVLALLDKMHRGEIATYPIGFPEGLTYKEIAVRLATTGFVDAAELVRLCEDAVFLKEQKVPGASCEGYLFPDTYRVAKGRSTREIVALFIAHHHEVFAKSIAPLVGDLKLTPHQIVTLGSIVEKETGAVEERPHIAGLFLNRLKRGMRLETDPTVIYAVSLAKGSFDGNIHKSDLFLDHPYNTYKRAGLPPGPISNPGVKALEAVVRPTPSEDLFFVSKNDGTHIFCPTLQCHEAAVSEWQIKYFKNKKKSTALKTKKAAR